MKSGGFSMEIYNTVINCDTCNFIHTCSCRGC